MNKDMANVLRSLVVGGSGHNSNGCRYVTLRAGRPGVGSSHCSESSPARLTCAFEKTAVFVHMQFILLTSNRDIRCICLSVHPRHLGRCVVCVVLLICKVAH